MDGIHNRGGQKGDRHPGDHDGYHDLGQCPPRLASAAPAPESAHDRHSRQGITADTLRAVSPLTGRTTTLYLVPEAPK